MWEKKLRDGYENFAPLRTAHKEALLCWVCELSKSTTFRPMYFILLQIRNQDLTEKNSDLTRIVIFSFETDSQKFDTSSCR